MGNCAGLCLTQPDKNVNPIEIDSVVNNNKKPNNDEKPKEEKKPEENKQEEELDIDMDFMKQNESKIVKMQANMKGRMVRKQMEDQKKKNEPNGEKKPASERKS